MPPYKQNTGVPETRRNVLRLWALENALPGSLSKEEIIKEAGKLIPEKFNEVHSYSQYGPPYFNEWAQDNIYYGYITKIGLDSYQITEGGIKRIHYIEKRFLAESV